VQQVPAFSASVRNSIEYQLAPSATASLLQLQMLHQDVGCLLFHSRPMAGSTTLTMVSHNKVCTALHCSALPSYQLSPLSVAVVQVGGAAAGHQGGGTAWAHAHAACSTHNHAATQPYEIVPEVEVRPPSGAAWLWFSTQWRAYMVLARDKHAVIQCAPSSAELVTECGGQFIMAWQGMQCLGPLVLWLLLQHQEKREGHLCACCRCNRASSAATAASTGVLAAVTAAAACTSCGCAAASLAPAGATAAASLCR
jgi:hypothetical protein